MTGYLCKHFCDEYKLHKPGLYKNGDAYCSTCIKNVITPFETNNKAPRCPCCGNRLRLRTKRMRLEFKDPDYKRY